MVETMEGIVRPNRAFLECGRGHGAGDPPLGARQPPVGDVGNHAVGDEERDDHRHRGVERDRAHERTHHAAHERHRHDGQDHGEGSHDRGPPDLVDRRENKAGKIGVGLLMNAAVDVLDDDDTVVDEEAQRQNERKERDPIDALPVDPADAEDPEQDERNGEGHDRRFAPTEEDEEDHHHGHDGQCQMFDQSVDRGVCLASVVSGHRHTHTPGKSDRLKTVQSREHLPCDGDPVRPLLPGQREGDGGARGAHTVGIGGPKADRRVHPPRRGTPGDGGHVPQENRPAVNDRDDGPAERAGTAGGRIHEERHATTVLWNMTGRFRAHRRSESGDRGGHTEPEGRKLADPQADAKSRAGIPLHPTSPHPGGVPQMPQPTLSEDTQRRSRQAG